MMRGLAAPRICMRAPINDSIKSCLPVGKCGLPSASVALQLSGAPLLAGAMPGHDRDMADGPSPGGATLGQRLRNLAIDLAMPTIRLDVKAVSSQLQDVADAVERLRRELDESEAARRSAEGQRAATSEQSSAEVQALNARVGRRDADIKTLHAKLKDARAQAQLLHSTCEEKDVALQGASMALKQAEIAGRLRQQEIEALREQMQTAAVTFRRQLESHMEGACAPGTLLGPRPPLRYCAALHSANSHARPDTALCSSQRLSMSWTHSASRSGWHTPRLRAATVRLLRSKQSCRTSARLHWLPRSALETCPTPPAWSQICSSS
jgi:hypothetical protein